MTKGEKLLIAQYRAQGMGYTAIAGTLGLPKNTVKSFCQRNGLGKDTTVPVEPVPEHICRQCGELLEQTAHRKTRRFCYPRPGNRRGCHCAHQHPDLYKRLMAAGIASLRFHMVSFH